MRGVLCYLLVKQTGNQNLKCRIPIASEIWSLDLNMTQLKENR